MKIIRKIIIALVLTTPYIALAQTSTNFTDILRQISRWLSMLIPMLYGLGILIFVWGLVSALWKGRESEDARKEGGKYAVFGVVIIFVAVSFSGLVWFIGNSVGVGFDDTLKPPCVKFDATTPCP